MVRYLPHISLAHASTHNFLPTTATSQTSCFITSLNCVNLFNLCLKGEIQENGTREKIFLAQTTATAPLKTPTAASTVRMCHHEPGATCWPPAQE